MINTKKVPNRRKLRFSSIDEALADAKRLVGAEADGTLAALGNWSLGQALAHLAYWAERPFDGYPELRPMPWVLRKIVKLMKGRFLSQGLPAGSNIPGVPGGTLGADPMPAGEALQRLDRALARLRENCPQCLNPLFGEMTHDEWIAFNLRHAELHLGFFRVD
ncbi:hypothetical protein Pla175_04180 [Pirellulimonas nuda]|uniref:DinB superfamily protein n=1 Tax=Pirellulimonas nuda TaxID=2528009 RepID=A0A518D6F1_9BACT|nr:DUF1569 domain-containing protein [Pirellulimonas nuda]QDU87063.1 hypothetical protein Pla175_04180 [Pirellulimonas nuda]